jgi:hypothetical protein
LVSRTAAPNDCSSVLDARSRSRGVSASGSPGGHQCLHQRHVMALSLQMASAHLDIKFPRGIRGLLMTR